MKSKPDTPASLAEAPIGRAFVVSHVAPPSGAPEWLHHLEDIGFIRGERVGVVARGLVGGDPLVVRVGLSTFALRLAEAACVHLVAVPAAESAEQPVMRAAVVSA